MQLVLTTSKGHTIDNVQVTEVSAFERNWNLRLERDWGNRVHFRTSLSPVYNCHGLTFSSRRCRITDNDFITLILHDDEYEIISETNAEPGDIIVYYDEDGGPTHSGIVVEQGTASRLKIPRILSKWGIAGEVLHNAPECPYGPERRYFRCRL